VLNPRLELLVLTVLAGFYSGFGILFLVHRLVNRLE